jgi:hypothetical protein
MADTPPLLPCPFCAGERPFRAFWQLGIQCNDCGAYAPTVAAWNMRGGEDAGGSAIDPPND